MAAPEMLTGPRTTAAFRDKDVVGVPESVVAGDNLVSKCPICSWSLRLPAALALVLALGVVLQLSALYGSAWNVAYAPLRSDSSPPSPSHADAAPERFLEVPQIVWGLNNQKIAFARACLTARLLNRTLLMPSLSASLFYKEVEQLRPIPFDKIFKFDRFNSLCRGFVRLARVAGSTGTPLELQKGSGRRWSKERDLDQLRQFSKPPYRNRELIRISGKNPFLWHDHWPVRDYARVFGCMEFVDEITAEADKVVEKIREAGGSQYVAVHMRIEKDWMIHCKHLEQRLGVSQICSSREEIMERVGRIARGPTFLYIAIADDLLEDGSVLRGWRKGIVPLEKKSLGVWDAYKKHPYLVQSAIDFEVCSRADVFVGNSFSTFSNLIVLERTQRMILKGVMGSCKEGDAQFISYAYNVADGDGGARRWVTNMADGSLQALSYGTINVSCNSFFAGT